MNSSNSNGWPVKAIREFARTASGGTPKRGVAAFYNGDIPWVKSGELGDKTVFEVAERITKLGLESSSAKLFPAGTLCIALYGATVGKLGILGIEAATNQAVCGIFLPPDVDTRYMFRFLESRRRELIEQGKGGAQPNISQDIIRNIRVPVPPLDDQQRIVEEIEKQFTRVDAGVASLQQAQVALKRYRATVLRAACEGRLVPTEAELAHKENRSYEPADVLLQRILNQHREEWNGKGKYKEPSRPNIVDLPFPPEGWTYASVGQLGIVGEQAVMTGPFGTNLGREDFTKTGVPVLTISCLKEAGVRLEKAEFVSERKAKELNRYLLRPGDLLFSRMASVGRAGIVTETLHGALFNYHIMRLRLEPSVLLAKFYIAYVRGGGQVESYLREVNHGATRAGINTEQLLNMPVAVPPFAEQQRIVAELERRLSVIEELETVVTANSQRANRLRRSILQKAFTKELPK